MNPPKTNLGFFPTPIVELPRLSQYLKGPRIFMKRDDQSGVALGGNKVRKLEYLVGDALDQQADTLVSGGAAQSNHCRQTAAAAAMTGLACHLALGGEAPDHLEGNLLLDAFFNAKIHWCGDQRKGETIPDICRALVKEGKKPYVIPYGGSNATGALGFVDAMTELKLQRATCHSSLSHIVFASSSGGTQAGLLVGAHVNEMDVDIIGIGIDKEEMEGVALDQYIINLANEAASRKGVEKTITRDNVSLVMDYVGGGYGVVDHLEKEALQLTASLEGILLDPVYTGRAMGGLIDLIRNGRFESSHNVLFWHTGGTPALFAYGESLLR
jgi:L-cysteate sulfo-lyase